MIFDQNNRVRINSLGKFFCKPDWVWDMPPRQFTDFDLWVLLEGKGQLRVGGREYRLHGGDCFLFRPGMTLYADNDHDEPLVVIYTHFDIIDAAGNIASPEQASLPALYRKIPDPVFYANILHRMLDCFYRNDQAGAENWLTAALLEISRHDSADPQLSAFSRVSEYIRKLYTMINEHPEKSYSLRKLATKAGYSPEHFSRLYRQHAGISFRQSISRARMNQAEYLLTATEYSIGQIAEAAGCPDIYLFSKLFKQHAGMSPSAYRKAIRQGELRKREFNSGRFGHILNVHQDFSAPQ